MANAVQRVRDAVAKRAPCIVSTPNTNFLIGCLEDSEFRDSVIRSDLNMADGMPLVWIARLLGIPIQERVAGSGLFEQLRKDTSAPLLVFFFGGKDGVAEAACRQLNAEPSGLSCVGFESPGFGSIEDLSSDSTIAKINASKADFVVVSLGAKKGQSWIERNRARLSAPVISHLGAVVNFVAGTVNRAPTWMQRSSLEWLWRIKEEPKLGRRYFKDGLALFTLLVTRVLPYAWYLQRQKVGADQLATASLETIEQEQYHIVRLRGRWTQQNLSPLRDCFAKAVLPGKDVKLEMSGITYVDSAFVGLVILLRSYQMRHGRGLLIMPTPTPVQRVIRYCCAEYLYSSQS